MFKIFKPISSIGNYYLLMSRVFKKPQKMSIFFKLVSREINDIGVNSFRLVVFTSLFVGAVVAIQMYNNFRTSDNIPIPDYYIGYATKTILILEFSPTIISVILAGKVGSFIASSIGTMRATEQIDELEIMGVNAPSFLILPKIIASVIFNPILITGSIVCGIYGGYIVGTITEKWSSSDYITGIQMEFPDYFFYYALIKTVLFAFVIATIPSYFGYNVEGGSLGVGRASTTAVVWTIVMIIILNLVLTQILLE